MRVAYLTSYFPMLTVTFVLNEVEAHHQAGVSVLPLSCDPVPAGERLSALARRWKEQTVSPAGFMARLTAVLRETVFHPWAMTKNVFWLLGLFFMDPRECLMGVKELGTAACLAPACRQQKAELIHVHFASRCLTTGIFLGRLVNTPVSCTAHAFEIWQRNARGLRYRLKRCRFVAAISRYNTTYLRGKCGNEIADLCRVVHCGIDLSRFRDRERAPQKGRILLVSQMTEKKGHRYLVEACAIMKKRGVEYECQLVGTGPEYSAIEQQIRDDGLGDSVKLLGPLANDEIEPLLQASTVFVLPAVVTAKGDQDGIPVALMEAMASGVPVISTEVSGIPELLRYGDAGRLVPQRNGEALADAIQGILENDAEAARLAKTGRQVVCEEFDIHKTSAQLRKLFAEVIHAGRVS